MSLAVSFFGGKRPAKREAPTPALVKAELRKWAEVVGAAKIKAD